MIKYITIMIRLVLLLAVPGIIVGLISAGAVIIQNHYIELGFMKTIITVIRIHTLRAALVGSGVGFLISWPLFFWLRKKDVNKGTVRSDSGTETGVLPALICFGCVCIVVAAFCTFYIQKNAPMAETISILATLCWLLLFIGVGWKIAKTQFKSMGEIFLFVLPFFLAIAVLIVGGLILNIHFLTGGLLGVARLAGNALWCGFSIAMFWLSRQLGHKVSRKIDSGMHLPSRHWLLSLCCILLVISCIFWAASPIAPYYLEGQALTHNVILIGIDTLRHDHVNLIHASDYRRDITPNLRTLAKRGTVFTAAISQSPWTMPAFASILTGKYPQEHGATSLQGSLRPGETTLAEILREAGFVTQGVVSSLYVDSRHGFAQGFRDFNDENTSDNWAITSQNVSDLALRFLDKHQKDRFFLFLHYYDPHYQYRDHLTYPYGDAYSGWLRQEEMDVHNLRTKRHLFRSADLEYLIDLYDEEIHYTDKHIGRILHFLEQKGLYQSTAVIVVADHGEEFMEHGWLGHTTSIYDQVVKVPLIAYLPGIEPVQPVVECVVETRSIFSTILEYLGIEDYKYSSPPSLIDPMRFGTLEKNEAPDQYKAFTSVWLPDAPLNTGYRVTMSCLRTSDWKIISDHRIGTRLLFDLRADPGERKDQSNHEIEIFNWMNARLEHWVEKMRLARRKMPPKQLRIDSEEIERLRSLGYL